MFKKLALYLLALVLPATVLSNTLPNKEIIILLETINYETLDKTLNAPNIYRYKEILHPVGIGATTTSFLIALYQQAAPIIVNKSLIKNVIDHQNFFSNFVNLDRKTLFKKYGTYNRFRGRTTLDNFRKDCQRACKLTSEVNNMLSTLIKDDTHNFAQIMNQITNHPSFQGSSFPELQNATENVSYIRSINLEMRTLILCSWIDFEKDWDIKQVNDDIFLLIPKNYTKSVYLKNSSKKSLAKFTDLELELGLKVDHMKTVNRNFFEKEQVQLNSAIPFSKSLEQIFIMTDELKTIKLPEPLHYTWSVYMSGHGLAKHPQLDILPQLYDLEKLYKSKLFPTTESTRKNRKNPNLAYNCEPKYLKKLRILNNEIKKSEALKYPDNKIDQGMINSLSINEFKDVVLFFNNKINTSFVYYSSCYSAGPHLIEPYLNNGKPLILNYTIMTGTPAENMSLQEFPFINIPPYFTPKDESIFEPFDLSQIDTVNKKLQLTTPLRFGKFFKLLKKGTHNNLKNLILLPYSLHPHIDEFGKIIPQRIANIPLVRLANTDHFQPIPHDNSSVVLNAHNCTKQTALDKSTSLICSDYISGKIIVNKLGKDNEIPKLVSMIPGFALHVFEEIDSSTLNLNEIINSFLTFPELGSSKIFWIKKLECKKSHSTKQVREHFKDVIIMRNVFNTNALDLCSDEEPLTLENCAYFSTSTRESKLAWDGPLVDDYNHKIIPCNQNSHKEECINCFPQAKSFLSPVLQSV